MPISIQIISTLCCHNRKYKTETKKCYVSTEPRFAESALPSFNLMFGLWCQLADELTNFFLKCNQSCPTDHWIDNLWLHVKHRCVVWPSCRPLEDNGPLWYSGEHLKSKRGTGSANESWMSADGGELLEMNVRQSALSGGRSGRLPLSGLPSRPWSAGSGRPHPAWARPASPTRQKNLRSHHGLLIVIFLKKILLFKTKQTNKQTKNICLTPFPSQAVLHNVACPAPD